MIPPVYSGEIPSSKFGHSFTLLESDVAVLFGGAQSQSKKFTIIADTYVLDLKSNFWKKAAPLGQPPISRAAHQAVGTGPNEMVLYGGAVANGGLADDNLFQFSVEYCTWRRLEVVGQTPGGRYGHSMAHIKRCIIVFGGSNHVTVLGDTWLLYLDRYPLNWTQLEIKGESPQPRIYHTASPYHHNEEDGAMMIFGGRSDDSKALSHAWLLHKTRDGQWEWTSTPFTNINDGTERYQVEIFFINQHTALFLGRLFMVLGGKGLQDSGATPFEIYNMDTQEWTHVANLKRYRHTMFVHEKFLYIYGGFEEEPQNTSAASIQQYSLQTLFAQFPALLRSWTQNSQNSASNYRYMTTPITQPSYATSLNQPLTREPNIVSPDLRTGSLTSNQFKTLATPTQNASQGNLLNVYGSEPARLPVDNFYVNQSQPSIDFDPSNTVPKQNSKSSEKSIKNFHVSEWVVVAQSYSPSEPAEKLTQKVEIAKLSEEHSKLGSGFSESRPTRRQIYIRDLSTLFINTIISQNRNFAGVNAVREIGLEDIRILCNEVQKIFESEDMVVKVSQPVKIFGTLAGQLDNLLSLFKIHGNPIEGVNVPSDIECMDYLFLGGYINRGTRSLETILLLFALKLKHPDQIFLLRGKHETQWLSRDLGLADECQQKLNDRPDEENSIFQCLNRTFAYMPIAALVEGKILCIYSGLWNGIRTISDLERMKRPSQIRDRRTAMSEPLGEMLWNKPIFDRMENEAEYNIQGPSKDKQFFGQKLLQFMQANQIDYVIRTGEPVMEGHHTWQSSVITIFSCVNYGGSTKNSAGLVHIRKNAELLLKNVSYDPSQYDEKWMSMSTTVPKPINRQSLGNPASENIDPRDAPLTPPRLR